MFFEQPGVLGPGGDRVTSGPGRTAGWAGRRPGVPRLARPAVPECHDDVCITCSDTAVAVTVVRLLGDDLALVDTGSGEEEVSVALVPAAAGDTILVHAGEAIAVVRRDARRPATARSPAARPAASAAAMESLYPFLYAGHERPGRGAGAGPPVHRGQDRRDRRPAARGLRPRRRPAARVRRGHGRPVRGAAGGCSRSATAAAPPTRRRWPRCSSTRAPACRALPAFGLASDTAVVTALCNDIGVGSGVRPPDRGVRAAGRHRGRRCPPAATPRTCCAPSTRPAGAGCSPSGSPATRAARWPSSTASTTCSSRRRPRCTGSRKPRPPSTTLLWELTLAALGERRVTPVTAPHAGRLHRQHLPGRRRVRRRGGAAGWPREELPDGTTVADYGIRGMHLAYDLAQGYGTRRSWWTLPARRGAGHGLRDRAGPRPATDGAGRRRPDRAHAVRRRTGCSPTWCSACRRCSAPRRAGCWWSAASRPA